MSYNLLITTIVVKIYKKYNYWTDKWSPLHFTEIYNIARITLGDNTKRLFFVLWRHGDPSKYKHHELVFNFWYNTHCVCDDDVLDDYLRKKCFLALQNVGVQF